MVVGFGSGDGLADFEGCKLLIFIGLMILESADPFKFKGGRRMMFFL